MLWNEHQGPPCVVCLLCRPTHYTGGEVNGPETDQQDGIPTTVVGSSTFLAERHETKTHKCLDLPSYSDLRRNRLQKFYESFAEWAESELKEGVSLHDSSARVQSRPEII